MTPNRRPTADPGSRKQVGAGVTENHNTAQQSPQEGAPAAYEDAPTATVEAVPAPPAPEDPMITAAMGMSGALKEVTLPLPLPGVADSRTLRADIVNQLDDYLIPRLRSLDAPLLTVVGGSTGAGKSTLINSLLQADITQAGVVRPTTKAPILVHHPGDERWFADQRVLPSLARVTGDVTPPVTDGKITTVHLVASASVPQGIALLDAPDIDSVVSANRDLAKQLLAAADMWVFVTTAARYADNVPWQFLRAAGRRGASVAVVLDRVPPAAMHEVRQDLAKLLAEGPLADVPLFSLEESELTNGRLRPEQVAELNAWLQNLAQDESARQIVIRRTLAGACEDTINQVSGVIDAQKAQQDAAESLRRQLDAAFAAELSNLSTALVDGSMLRGEVLARWHDFLGTSGFSRTVESRISWLRDKIANLFNRSAPTKPLGDAVLTGVTALIVARAQAAMDATVDAWSSEPGGEYVLTLQPQLSTADPTLTDRTERMVRDWQRAVVAMVREQCKDRMVTARAAAIGINAVALIVMIIVFAGTALIPTGAEVAAAAGTTVIGQKVLEAIFGDDAVRRMTKLAHNDLLERASGLLAYNRTLFTDALDSVEIDAEAAVTLEQWRVDLEAARS